MNPGQEHIDKIRTAFKEMQGKEDFLALLNVAKPLVYGEHTIPFELKQLTWHSNPKLDIRRYKTFEVRKKSGDKRTIHAPQRGLKALQKTISFILQCVYTPHKSATGFIWDKSIVDNATIHAGSRYVYNTDLKDFFPSIDQARVWKCLQLKPFNLKDERLVIANMIAAICCTEMEVERKNNIGEWEKVKRNVLPQGAPTSPVITNIICQRLDFLLSAVAKRFGLNYSRYADDITFSSMHNVYQADSDFNKELHRIIVEQRFDIKESKTRLQKDGYRKEVTGLLVNEKVNVQKRYIKQLRQWLYYWEQYGYEKASVYFIQKYIAEKGHVKKGIPGMEYVIAGKLDYLKMVKGGENELYVKLKERFDKMNGVQNPMDQLLTIWENQGIETAMNFFTTNRKLMSKNKYDFIIEILNNKKLSSSQKERIHKLSAIEINNENTKEEEILKRIEEIKIIVKTNDLKKKESKQKNERPPKTPNSELIKYIDPKNLYSFLKDYNTDFILKTTCHEIDSNELENICNFCETEEYEFRKHRQKVQERFLKLVNNKKYFIGHNIKNLIYVYITGKKYNGNKDGWTDDKISINWNTESIENWCDLNKNKIPHPDSGLCNNQGGVEYEIKPSINTKVLGQKKLRSFSDLILHFKYLFHLRSDNSLLKIIAVR